MSYNDTTYSNLGYKLRSIRKELCLTQNQVAEGIVTRNMLSRIEKGSVTPSLLTLTKLAERLEIPVGYLIDDNDDGTILKNDRLMTMIIKEFEQGNYGLCLQYLENLEFHPDEKSRLTACSKFLLGVQQLYDDKKLKDAQTLINDALKAEKYLTSKMISDGLCLRALIDAFSYDNSSGNEENVIIGILKFAKSPSDYSVLAGILNAYKTSGIKYAENMLNNSVIENKSISSLITGKISLEYGDYKQALNKLIEALSGNLPSPIRCYCLTLLEKNCAAMSDFERAYSYMNLRKQIIKKLF